MLIKTLIKSRTARSFGAAFIAFLAYGSWAFYVNQEHGQLIGLKAALTQGGYSFLLTLSMSWITEWIFLTLKTYKMQFLLTVVSTCLMLYSTSWSINALLGTPEILMTILPGAIVGTLYTISYSYTLTRLQPKLVPN